MQVAFIITGTHTTYYIKSKHALGIDVVNWYNFQSTVEMYPVVKSVDKMCEDAKDDMRCMNLVCAVTTADGTWMTRGFHSKNATFSIRNYFIELFLHYFIPATLADMLAVKKSSIEIYQGTSKGILNN